MKLSIVCKQSFVTTSSILALGLFLTVHPALASGATGQMTCEQFLAQTPTPAKDSSRVASEAAPLLLAHTPGFDWAQVSMKVLKNIDVMKTLLRKDASKEWLAQLEQRPTMNVRKTDFFIRRNAVNGGTYSAYYSKYTPEGKIRKTIILQHGFTKSAKYFHDMIYLLTYMGYEVITPDATNTANTLRLSDGHEGTVQGVLTGPSPLDDANAIRDIVIRERLTNFVLIGHSRGHAITALVAAMPDMASRIEKHVALNPYVQWINDYYIDEMLSKSLIKKSTDTVAEHSPDESVLETAADPAAEPSEAANNMYTAMFNPWKVWVEWNANLKHAMKAVTTDGNPWKDMQAQVKQAITEKNAELMRYNFNKFAMTMLAKVTAKELGHREDHETEGSPDLQTEIKGVAEIAEGLAGKKKTERGYDVLPLYDAYHLGQDRSKPPMIMDNGFGLLNPGNGIGKISADMKARTWIVSGVKDKLVTKPMVKLLTESTGVHAFEVPGAGHYMPSEQPFQIVDIIEQILSGQNPK